MSAIAAAVQSPSIAAFLLPTGLVIAEAGFTQQSDVAIGEAGQIAVAAEAASPLVVAVAAGPPVAVVLAEPQATVGAVLEIAGVGEEQRGLPRGPEGIGKQARLAAVLRFDQLGIRSAAAQLLPSS